MAVAGTPALRSARAAAVVRARALSAAMARYAGLAKSVSGPGLRPDAPFQFQ